MSVITDLYTQLFGKDHIKDGDVISFSEHGRAGGLSTGQGFKYISNANETILIDAVDSSTTYLGKAAIGTATSVTSWQIKKISVSGAITTIAFAGGTDNYINEWDERAGYSYS